MANSDKVLHVFKYFRPDFTGEGVFLERIAPEFRRQQATLTHDVLCTMTAQSAASRELLDGIDRVRYLEFRGVENLLTSLKLVWWTLSNIGRYRTVHYHTHVDRTFASYWVAGLMGKRIVLSATLDDSPPSIAMTYNRRWRPLVRFLLRRFDAFVSISPKLYQETIAAIGAARAHLIPMGIRIPELSDDLRRIARRELGIEEDAPTLLSVGGICRRKDQMTLVQAMVGVVRRFPKALLILVGPVLEPEYAESLHEFIAQNGLERHIRFAGWVREPWDYYRAADVMVFASTEEGFGTVMIEAMSYSLPVVARLLHGVNDSFIQHTETGFLFTNNEQMEETVSSLLSNDARRRDIGHAARAYVVPRFGMEQVARRYLEVYGLGSSQGPIAPKSNNTQELLLA